MTRAQMFLFLKEGERERRRSVVSQAQAARAAKADTSDYSKFIDALLKE